MAAATDYIHQTSIVLFGSGSPYKELVGNNIRRRLLIFSWVGALGPINIAPWVDADNGDNLFQITQFSPLVLTWHDYGSLVTGPWYGNYSNIAAEVRVIEMINRRG